MENSVLLQSFVTFAVIIACKLGRLNLPSYFSTASCFWQKVNRLTDTYKDPSKCKCTQVPNVRRLDLSHDLIESLKVMKLLTTKMQAGTSPQNITTSGCLFISEPKVTFNITSGKVYGLIVPGLEIRGFCSAPGWIGSEVTIGCYGSFNSVRAHFDGAATLNSTTHYVNFIATPSGSVDVLVELAAEPGGRARLRTWRVHPLNITVNPTYPGFLSRRMTKNQLKTIDSKLSNCAANKIYEVLVRDYKKQLVQVVSDPSIDIPLPSF
ncbi:uncharacterized protein [Dermacentor albipictus]|uniref:uncharacterized protein isoform X3 n=1 Tax=Dermacentor albipictus TaxID=60249 RepID=UPI0031FCF9C8